MINCVLSILLIEWALSKLKPLRPITAEQKALHQKYKAFRRNDLDKINRIVLYAASPITFLRFLIGWGSIMINSIFVFLISCFHKRGEPYKGIPYLLVKYSLSYAARIVMFMMSAWKIDEIKLKTDYSKYLGPDWKRTYDNPGTIISNH